LRDKFCDMVLNDLEFIIREIDKDNSWRKMGGSARFARGT